MVDKLSNYKQNNLKKKLPSEVAAEDLELKRTIAKQMEDSDRAFEEHMSKMSNNMDKLVGAISLGFTKMQRMLQPPSPAAACITPTVQFYLPFHCFMWSLTIQMWQGAEILDHMQLRY
jgi:hypothetical protein